MLRAIREIQPTWVVGENVPGLINWSKGLVFEQVQTDLEAEGYEVQSFILPACGVNAPHRRDRVWIVAFNPNYKRKTAGFGQVQSEDGEIPEWDNDAEFSDTGNEFATDTESEGGTGLPIGEQTPHAINGINGITTNSGDQRLQGSEVGGGIRGIRKGSNEQPTGRICTAWQNFPTQSPICTGNDGLPTESLRQRIREDCLGTLSEKEIDKIISEAHSEWVKETIKAGGNAIVNQVALQIFKSIDQFTKEIENH